MNHLGNGRASFVASLPNAEQGLDSTIVTVDWSDWGNKKVLRVKRHDKPEDLMEWGRSDLEDLMLHMRRLAKHGTKKKAKDAEA